MKIERAIQILDPEHRENYDDIEIVNEACRMGAAALCKCVKESVYPEGLNGDIIACSRCGSGEYLHNEDGNENKFCGQCGQAIEWGPEE